MHDVMISYSSKDKAIADAICHQLEGNEIRAWFAPRDILGNKKYTDAIINGIKDCSIIVLIFSENANASVWVPRELERGVAYGKIIIPFKLEDVAAITPDFELCTSTSHWLDAITPPIERNIEELVRIVKLILQKETNPYNEPVRKKFTTLSPLGEFFQLTTKWAQNDYEYFVLEGLNNDLKSILRNTPRSIEIEDQDVLLFMMIASLQYGGNWGYWQARVKDTDKAVGHLLKVLEISYFRPKLRALYALQKYERAAIQEKIAGTGLVNDSNLVSVLEEYVFAKQVIAYLEKLAHSADLDTAKKTKVVLDEIKRYKYESGSASSSVLPGADHAI